MKIRTRSYPLIFATLFSSLCLIGLIGLWPANVAGVGATKTTRTATIAGQLKRSHSSVTKTITISETAQNVKPNVTIWNPYFYAIPGSDGTTLLAAVENVAIMCEKVTFRGGLDGKGDTLFDAEPIDQNTYLGTVLDFFPGCANPPCTAAAAGSLAVECDRPGGDNLTSLNISLQRFYIPSKKQEEADGVIRQEVTSTDNQAILFTDKNSLMTGHYVIIMALTRWPAPSPAGITFVGQPYAIRAAGPIAQSNGPMGLRLRYSDQLLGGRDPFTLRILTWDSSSRAWRDEGTQALFTIGDQFMSKTVTQFTTYILALTPAWRDDFSTVSGLDYNHPDSNVVNIQHNAVNGKLSLAFSDRPGHATSKPYTLTTDLEAWDSISYTAKITAGTGLTVSILGLTGSTPLTTNLAPGASLADIDPGVHPSLRLRVDMAPAPDGASPELLEWSILARPKEADQPTIYLPLVIKARN